MLHTLRCRCATVLPSATSNLLNQDIAIDVLANVQYFKRKSITAANSHTIYWRLARDRDRKGRKKKRRIEKKSKGLERRREKQR